MTNVKPITITGWTTEAVRTTPRVWSVSMRSNGIEWKLVEQVNNPGIFNLYNSGMKNTGKMFRLTNDRFELVTKI
jgi:hypothetical protein